MYKNAKLKSISKPVLYNCVKLFYRSSLFVLISWIFLNPIILIYGDLLPKEILEQSKVVMSAPLVYEISSNAESQNSTIYQRPSPGSGRNDWCLEMHPGANTISFLYLNGSLYRIMPNNVVLEMRFISEAGPISLSPYDDIIIDSVEASAAVPQDGYYKLKCRLKPNENSISQIYLQFKNQIIPDVCEFTIDKSNFRLRAVTLFSKKSKISQNLFDNFRHLNSNDDLHLMLPPASKIESLTDTQGYIAAISNQPAIAPKNIPNGYMFDPKTHHIVKVDTNTGKISEIPKTSTNSKFKGAIISAFTAVSLIALVLLIIKRRQSKT